MGNFGFFCPHCRTWWSPPGLGSVAADDLVNDYCIDEDEIANLATLCRKASVGTGDGLSDESRLIRCVADPDTCPASFEAFLFRDSSTADDFAAMVGSYSWAPLHNFRVFSHKEADKPLENGPYIVAINVLPVQRLPHIDIGELIHPELLRRWVRDIAGHDLGLPVTLYTASTFLPHHDTDQSNGNNIDRVQWIPVETELPQTSGDQPPQYKEFCRTLRTRVTEVLREQVTGKALIRKACPLYTERPGAKPACGRMGRVAVCAAEDPSSVDWNRCPAFLELRKQCCPGYRSDMKLVEQVEQEWRKPANREALVEEVRGPHYHCDFDFHEVAVSLTVHDHLAGVLCTGQICHNIEDTKKKVKRYKEAMMCNAAFADAAEQAFHTFQHSDTVDQFIMPDADANEATTDLVSLANHMAEALNARYRDNRARSEQAFRTELLGWMETHRDAPDFDRQHFGYVLERMRTFWAFQAAHLLRIRPSDKRISVIAEAHKSERWSQYGFSGKDALAFPGDDSQAYSCMHSTAYPHQPGTGYDDDNLMPVVKQLLPSFDALIGYKNEILRIPDGNHFLFVAIPYNHDIYLFIFSSRDLDQVAAVTQRVQGRVSRFARNVILQTCTEVLYKCSDIEGIAKHRHDIVSFVGHELDYELYLLETALAKCESTCGTAGDPSDAFIHMKDVIRRLRAVRSAARLSALATHLQPRKDILRIQEDIAEPIARMVRAFPGAGFREIITDVDHSCHETTCCADVELVHLALIAMMRNAIIFSHAYTNIWLRCCKQKYDQVEYVRFEVVDYGDPVAPHDLLCYGEGHRGNNAHHHYGHGLGLHLVKRIVEAHGGRIEDPRCDNISDHSIPYLRAFAEYGDRRDVSQTLEVAWRNAVDNGLVERVVSENVLDRLERSVKRSMYEKRFAIAFPLEPSSATGAVEGRFEPCAQERSATHADTATR